MSEVDKHLPLPSLNGYRLAIGYVRVVKGGVDNFSSFTSEFGGHGLSLCFRDSLQEVVLIWLASQK
jgi:hypothetical protein